MYINFLNTQSDSSSNHVQIALVIIVIIHVLLMICLIVNAEIWRPFRLCGGCFGSVTLVNHPRLTSSGIGYRLKVGVGLINLCLGGLTYFINRNHYDFIIILNYYFLVFQY